MNITIRQERKEDQKIVESLITNTFEDVEISNHQEQFLVKRLRKTDAFIPGLSLVALLDEQIIGHILLTRIRIENNEDSYESLALAPVSVLPEFQGKGVGGRLIQDAHRIAKSFGFKSVILLGHAAYYPRFGYQRASKFGIQLPFEVPDENCMAIELIENGLADVHGTVKYHKAFFE